MMIRNIFCLLVAMVFSSAVFSAPETSKKITDPVPAFSCKGQAEDACAKTDACLWVQGFERSDGIQVNAYCRKSMRKKTVVKDSKKATEKTQKEALKKKPRAKPKVKAVNARADS